MGLGKMTFQLYIKQMPDNMKFTITEIQAIDPPEGGSWYKYQSCPQTPFTVDLASPSGKVGDFYLGRSSDSSGFQSGPGPKFEIKFIIEGTAPTGVSSSRSGLLTISTTEWGTLVRPDNGIITFVFDGSAASMLNFPTPALVSLDDCNVVVLWLDKETAVGMSITSDKTFIKQLCEYALGGIFKGHEKAASWAIGKVW